MVNTLDSQCNWPGFDSRPWIWVNYPCGSATSFARVVKQGCRLCTHAFKIMHGCWTWTWTWITKRKSKGLETINMQITHTDTLSSEVGVGLTATNECSEENKWQDHTQPWKMGNATTTIIFFTISTLLMFQRSYQVMRFSSPMTRWWGRWFGHGGCRGCRIFRIAWTIAIWSHNQLLHWWYCRDYFKQWGFPAQQEGSCDRWLVCFS